MEVLKSAGKFELLTPEEELREQLKRIELAGRTCYQSVKGEITLETASKFTRMLLRSGHESVLEHSHMAVRFSDVSRGFTHEMVRHRHTGYSQESTRYVDYAERGEGPDIEGFRLRCVAPPHRDEDEPVLLGDGRSMSLREMFEQEEVFYRGLRKAGWVPQDARQVLPIGTKSEIVVSTNFREWRSIFGLRTGKPAHWEIRQVMGNLLEVAQGIVPVVFDDFVEDGVDNNGLRYFRQDREVWR